MNTMSSDLDRIHLRYSYKQTCVVTLTVGDVEGNDEWHLPTYDPHNQNKYHYKLHSLDIYFWTHQDALQFVNGIRRVLPPELCEVLDEPGPPPRHANEMSPVIQQLERAAISDAGSIQATPAGVEAGAPTFPGPPVAAVEAVPPPAPQQFAPIAYNPAAPAAPEQVRHREKTPPPEDGVANPLHQTLAYDATTPFSPGLAPSGLGPLSPGIPPPNLQHPPGAPTFPGPPQHSVTSPGFAPQGFGSLGGQAASISQQPPQHPGITRATTMPVHGVGTPLSSPGLASPYSIGAFPGHGQHTPGVANTPTPPAAGVGMPPQGQPQGDHSIHQQYFIPKDKYKPKQETKGKFEQGAGRLEKGVSGLLKRVEKKFG